MSYHLFIQLSKNHPSDFTDNGDVDMTQAIEAFETFEWQNNYNLVQSSKKSHLISPLPAMIFENKIRNESLCITYFGKNEFEIKCRTGNIEGSEIVTKFSEENEGEVTIKDFIVAFFEKRIEELIDLTEQDEDIYKHLNTELTFGKYNPLKQLRYPAIIILVTLLIVILLLVNFMVNGQIILLYLLIILTLLMVIFSPVLFFFVHYYVKPKVLSVSIDHNKKGLNIIYPHEKVHIENKNILQCNYIFTKNIRHVWSGYENVVLILNDNTKHILTTLTFSSNELKRILEILNLKFYKRAVFFPFINTKLIDESALRRVKYKPQRTDLIEFYANYKDDELLKIIQNEAEYQEEAVEIARNELKKRGNGQLS